MDADVSRAGDQFRYSLVLDELEARLGCGDDLLVHRTGKAIALAIVDAQADERLDRIGRLRPFGDALHAQLVREVYDHARDRIVRRIAIDVTHEAAVDLDQVGGNLLQVIEG